MVNSNDLCCGVSRFLSYLNLFVMSTFNLTIVAIRTWIADEDEESKYIDAIFLLATLGPLQSIHTFLIFIMKDEVRRSLLKFFRRDSPMTVWTEDAEELVA